MTLEEIYDEQINPLMAQIIKICKDNKLPMLASFCLSQPTEDEGLFCTTSLLAEDFNPPERFLEALDAINYQPSLTAFAISGRITKGKS